ncbi:MAG TPA: DNA translocase FtsK 4TM domain-containing protein, partial [Rugosimonospora sp.]|nr:DNA translocase FtsK 4TM domain-containing protein [Rugosimonospora sp.]
MAGRTPSAGSRSASRRGAGSRGRRNAPPVGPLDVIPRLFVLLWMGLAHGVGWLVRAVGRKAAGAKELDPEHRRDGAGLLLLAAALLMAVAVWFQGAGPVGVRLSAVTRFFFGAISMVLPILLAFGAIRLMRDKEEEPHRGRGLVGWGSLFIGVAGLLHLGAGRPTLPSRTD